MVFPAQQRVHRKPDIYPKDLACRPNTVNMIYFTWADGCYDVAMVCKSEEIDRFCSELPRRSINSSNGTKVDMVQTLESNLFTDLVDDTIPPYGVLSVQMRQKSSLPCSGWLYTDFLRSVRVSKSLELNQLTYMILRSPFCEQ